MTRVLMIPAQSNPYQTLLATALAEQDVQVVMGRGPGPRAVLPVVGDWLRAGRPRVIHLHWTHRYQGPMLGRRGLGARRTLWELRLLRKLGVRLVWTLHNIGDHEGRKGAREMSFHRALVELSGAVICHCLVARELAIEAYELPQATRARLQVVPHGNYTGWYPDTLGRDAARAVLGLTASERVFLFIGQIRRYKGVEELLRVFRGIEAPDVRLVIAGKPDRKKTRTDIELEAEGDPRVSLALEIIPDDRMQVYLRAADAVVLPYRDVLTSGSAILAMSFGLPVIAPAIGCLPESLGAAGTLLYDAATPDGMERALREAMTADLAALGDRAAALAASLSWGPIAERTAQLYRGG